MATKKKHLKNTKFVQCFLAVIAEVVILMDFFFLSGPSLSSQTWCQLAYWELSKRVGPLFPVEQPSFNVFGNMMPHGDGICLETLARHNYSPPELVCRTRGKIGLGKLYLHTYMLSIAQKKVFRTSST